jgi:hypothetical protein
MSTTPSDSWDGSERRLADQRLSAAIAEVHDLREAAAKLAEAVVVRSAEFQRLIRQVAFLLAGMLVIIMLFSLWQVGRLNAELKRGHVEITCLLLVDPAARTAQTLIDCQRG